MAVIVGINGAGKPLLTISVDAATNKAHVKVEGKVDFDANELLVLANNPAAKFELRSTLFGADSGLNGKDDKLAVTLTPSVIAFAGAVANPASFKFEAANVPGKSLNEDSGKDEIYAHLALSNNANFNPAEIDSNVIEFAFHN